MVGEHILVVEDDGIIALRIQELLIGAGYRVTDPVPSGEEALDCIGKFRPDLVLMDIGLSGKIDGLKTASEIRDRYDIPIIFLTAYADERRISLGKDISPFGYIIKPFRDEKLLKMVSGAFVAVAARRLETSG